MDARLRHNRQGFTLIELLVTLAIAAIAVAAVSTFNLINQRETIENKLINELQDDMRYAIRAIVPYVRMGSNLQIDRDTVTDAITVTVVIPPEVNSGENFVFGFNPAQGTLWVRASSQPICSHIAALHVTSPDSNGLVTLELVSVSELPGVRHGLPLILETSVTLRNY